jgi:tetratricopeptide (TPR) repeat protein
MRLIRFNDFDSSPRCPASASPHPLFHPSPLPLFPPSPLRPISHSPRSFALSLIVAISLVLAVGCKRDSNGSLERAVEAWDSANYKLAAEEYERYLSLDPTSEKAADARFQVANIYYFNLQRYDQARAHYATFLTENSLHGSAPLARERLAEVLSELGRSYDAIAEYENMNPQDSGERRRIRLRIADLYFAQKNYSQALTEYEKVIETGVYDDLTEQAYLREASIYHIERSQYDQALPVYQRLALDSADPEVRLRAMYGLADCYAGVYRFDEAIKTLREIKDDVEEKYIAERIAALEAQRREAEQAKNGLQP